MSDEKQMNLFKMKEWWEDEWEGMPEFNHRDLTPWNSVIIHFKDRGDMELFSKLIDQTITFKTQSLWYPQAKIGRYSNKRYIDES